MSEKRTLSAKEILLDIKIGLTDAQLMMKYGLSAKGLQSLKNKLEAAGLVSKTQIEGTSLSKESTSADRRALAESVAGAVKSGLSDPEIVSRFGIPPRKLSALFTSLTKAGYLTQEDLDRRSGDFEQTVDLAHRTIEVKNGATSIEMGTGGKRTLSAKAILADVKDGMTNAQLLTKYSIYEEPLGKILTKFVDAGLISKAEYEQRSASLNSNEEQPDSLPEEGQENTSSKPGKVIQVDVDTAIRAAKGLIRKAKGAADKVARSVQAQVNTQKGEGDPSSSNDSAKATSQRISSFLNSLNLGQILNIKPDGDQGKSLQHHSIFPFAIIAVAFMLSWFVSGLLTSSWLWFIVYVVILGAVALAGCWWGMSKLDLKIVAAAAGVLLVLNVAMAFVGRGDKCCNLVKNSCEEIDEIFASGQDEKRIDAFMTSFMPKAETRIKEACGDCSDSVKQSMGAYLMAKGLSSLQPGKTKQPSYTNVIEECRGCRRKASR